MSSSKALVAEIQATQIQDATDPRDVQVGQAYRVGKHFWIEDAYGYAEGAYHGHGKHEEHNFDNCAGSADTDARVGVLADNGNGQVRCVLLRDSVPYGALAAHGTLFTITKMQIRSWASDGYRFGVPSIAAQGGE